MANSTAATQHEAPIFVTGMPRSGTTFVQHLLCAHPSITIHGQEPARFSWGDLLKAAVQGVGDAASSNAQLNYDAPHYASPSEPAEVAYRMLDFVKWYLTGGRSDRRWGSKSLTQCRVAADVISECWPATRWIVCIRDPFRSVESLRNTYDRGQQIEIETLTQWWTDAAGFAHENTAAMPVVFDRLEDTVIRMGFVEQLFEFVGEPATEETLSFAQEWPVIHKVTEDQHREYCLSTHEREQMLDCPDFSMWVERLGYESKEAVAS